VKQCPNPNCTIYTSLEELPDTYLRCPLCKEELVEVAYPTGALDSSQLAEEDTSPYAPPRRPDYVQRSLYEAGNPYVVRTGAEQAEDVAEDPPEETAAGSHAVRRSRIRSCATVVGAVVLVTACAALAVNVGGRILPHQPDFSAAVATQNAVAQLRPPINTPIAILPTIPLSNVGGLDRQPGSAAPDSQPPQQPESQPQSRPPTQAVSAPAPIGGSLAPAPILDAQMCARLEGGQPVGSTSAYHPADPFNLAVQASFGQGGVQSVLTRWYGPDGAAIYDLKQDYTQQGTYYAGFTLSRVGPWPTGDYRVDIYTNGSPQPAQTVSFSVISP
jgi:hypothetical protein